MALRSLLLGRRSLALPFALALPATPAQQDPSFSAGLVIAPSTVRFERILDTNTDGIPDAVSWWWTNDQFLDVRVRNFVGDGEGHLEQVGGALLVDGGTTSSARNYHDTEVGDFDGDGRPELAIGLNSRVLFVDFAPDGGMSELPALDTSPLRIEQLLVADFDQDGLDDLLAGSGPELRLYLNRGPGQAWVESDSFQLGGVLAAFGGGELNGDGRPDVVVRHGNLFTSSLKVFSVSAGTLSTPVSYAHDLGVRCKLVVGDVDGDGDDDIALFDPSTYQVFRRTGTASFVREPPRTGGPATDLIDVDRDGHVDGVCCGSGTTPGAAHNDGASIFRVARGDGTGHFATASQYPGLGAEHLAGALDYDGDGDLDLVAGRTVLLNLDTIGAGFCPATPNSTTLAAELGATGSASVARGDLELSCNAIPPQAFGMFVVGETVAAIPVGGGTLCVGTPFHRLPVQQASSAGALSLTLDYSTLPPGGAGAIEPGATKYFQTWFRDTAPGAAGSNLSSGLRITFAP